MLTFLTSLAQTLSTQLLPFFLLVDVLFKSVTAIVNMKDECHNEEQLQALEKTVLQLQEAKNYYDESEEM